MINKRGNDFIFNQKGFPLGIISDGDSLDRPDGSLADLVNFDYDVESGELRTRNSTSNSDILNGFTLPTGYLLMAGGVKLFSFNNPVDREVRLVFVKNTIAPFDVRIYVNTWFNPPAENTDNNNDYENYILSKTSNTWFDEWIEITEYEPIDIFTKTGAYTFDATGSALVYAGQENYYRGWFAWNATKWNSGITNKIKNESFACIQAYDSVNSFTIQGRLGLSLTDLGWMDGDKIYLIRYPIIVHKALDTSVATTNLRMSFTPSEANWIVKTNINIEILNGEEGGLWFGFVNKDITKLDKTIPTFANLNRNKRFGWWFDYETIPVMPDLTSYIYNGGSNYIIYLDSKVAFQIPITFGGVETTDKMVAFSLQVDGHQHICILKGMDATIGKEVNWLFRPYHHYSRRFTAWYPYSKDTTDVNEMPLNNFAGNIGTVERFSGGQVQYLIFYDYGNINPFNSNFPFTATNNGIGLESRIQYQVNEQIFTKASFGQFAQGRMFVSGDDDYPDTVRYSLFQREDIFALQNQKSIDATDKDKNTAIDLLGINPVVFKNRSIHIANIEGETEVGWRLIETKSRVGCPYPRSIARTNYGLTFSNDEGYWLLQDAGEPANLFKGRRLQAYLALTNKSQIFAEWYGKHSEVWIYVGNKTFWVCKLNKEERIIGFKTYSFNFTPIDIFTDDNGDLFIQGTNFIYKYNNDDEVTDGEDADGSGIAWSFTPNYNTFDRYSPFHHIETIISFKGTNKDGLIPNGNYQTINISIYKENDEVIQTKSKTYNVSSSSPLSLVVKNDTANRQRALKIKVYGTLTNLKRLEFTEINSRCKAVVTQTKSAYKEIA